MINVERVYQFLESARSYSLATVDGDQPRVRIFGTILLHNGKLYIQTGKKKDVAKQLYNNPKAEIIAFKGTDWVRIECKLYEADDRELRVLMLEKMPTLRQMYNEDDGNMVMFEIKDGKATFQSFVKPSVVLTF